MHRVNHFAEGIIENWLSTIHDEVTNLSLTQLKDKLYFHSRQPKLRLRFESTIHQILANKREQYSGLILTTDAFQDQQLGNRELGPHKKELEMETAQRGTWAGISLGSGTRIDWIISERGDNIACLFLQSIHEGTGAVNRTGFTLKDSRGLELAVGAQWLDHMDWNWNQ